MKFSNKKFYIWDGNHRHLAWMLVIEQFHYDNPDFHVAVRSTILNVTWLQKTINNFWTQWHSGISMPLNLIMVWSYAWILFIHFLINAFKEEQNGPRCSALDTWASPHHPVWQYAFWAAKATHKRARLQCKPDWVESPNKEEEVVPSYFKCFLQLLVPGKHYSFYVYWWFISFKYYL